MYRPYITGPIPSLQTTADVSKCLNFTNVSVAEYGQNVTPAWVLRVWSEDECGFSTWCAGLPLSYAAGRGPQAGRGTRFAHPAWVEEAFFCLLPLSVSQLVPTF